MWLPAVPGFLLKLVLGEMATLALMSQNVSNAKIASTGFTYAYPTLESALMKIYKS
jgi:NAD dependent epimerase/dehydratase family enzyme